MNESFTKALRDQIKNIQADPQLSFEDKQTQIQSVLRDRIMPAVVVPPSDCKFYPDRKCKLECIQCKKYYHCRFCHNENEGSHKFDRHNVEHISCIVCETVQSPTPNCISCGIEFSKYYCDICHLYGDSTDVFHCDGCGICRKGPQEDYQHCSKCKMCISKAAFDEHKCFSHTFEGNCAICGYGLFDVIGYGTILRCGHALHQTPCMQTYIESNYRCPLCKKSMVDMSEVWKMHSEQYREALLVRNDARTMQVYCNDCSETFAASYSPFLLYQCDKCNGFNTNV